MLAATGRASLPAYGRPVDNIVPAATGSKLRVPAPRLSVRAPRPRRRRAAEVSREASHAISSRSGRTRRDGTLRLARMHLSATFRPSVSSTAR